MRTLRDAEQVKALLRDAVREPKPFEFEVLCPMCAERGLSPDASGNLGINLQKGVFHCWRCGWGGSIRRFVSDVRRTLGLDQPAKLDLAAIKTRPRWEKLPTDGSKLPRGFVEITPESRGFLAHCVLSYLRKRGFDDDVIRRLHPGATAEMPARGALNCQGRVILPCVLAGQVVFWVARTWGSAEPKTLNPKLGDGETKPLWGLDDIPLRSWVAVTEGIFDAAVTPNGVAVLGDRMTDAQSYMLASRAPLKVVFLYDGDAAGRAGAARDAWAYKQRWGGDVRVANLPDGFDPCNFARSPGWLRDVIQSAVAPNPAKMLNNLAGKIR